MRQVVLVADDEEDLLRVLEKTLSSAGYAVIACRSEDEVARAVTKTIPNVFVLDVLLGPTDSRDLCKKLRARPATRRVPIVLMSGTKINTADMVRGLQGGADDYLLKPFQPELLLAKVAAVLRRYGSRKTIRPLIRFRELSMRLDERRALLGKKEIRLTKKEFDLLEELVENQGKVLSAEHLLEIVWDYEPATVRDPHTVEVHLSRLKKKLGPVFSKRIVNLVGSGYRLG